jgi:hypothetical protein
VREGRAGAQSVRDYRDVRAMVASESKAATVGYSTPPLSRSGGHDQRIGWRENRHVELTKSPS